MTPAPARAPDNLGIAAGNSTATSGAEAPVLDIDDVTKTYPGEPPVQALRGLSLTIGPPPAPICLSTLDDRTHLGSRGSPLRTSLPNIA